VRSIRHIIVGAFMKGERVAKLTTSAIDRDTLRTLRQRGGDLLRQRRVFLGLTQQELAERVGLDSYTILAQLESGIGRIEPYQYEQWAQALELPISRLVASVLEHTDPVAHRLFVSQVLLALH
jgi:DNA-binding XRE family transcriptional regulator